MILVCVRFLTMKSWLLTSALLLALVACPGSGSIEKPRPQKWQLVFRSPFANRNDVASAEVKHIENLMRQMMVVGCYVMLPSACLPNLTSTFLAISDDR